MEKRTGQNGLKRQELKRYELNNMRLTIHVHYGVLCRNIYDWDFTH